jgi:hypothetical protein
MQEIKILTVEEQIKRISRHVNQKIDDWSRELGSDFNMLSRIQESRQHIVQIGTSILCTKWGVGHPGGSFVQAVVDNKLTEAFGRADSTNKHCLEFYAKLIYNTSYIE